MKTCRSIRSPGLGAWLLPSSPITKQRKKGKDGQGERRHEIHFVLTTKAIRGAGREENRHPREVEECSTTTWPGKGCPGGRVRGALASHRSPPKSPAASRRAVTRPDRSGPSPGAAAAGEEEEEAEEDTKPAPLTQKMTLKPKMKYLMQQLTSGPL